MTDPVGVSDQQLTEARELAEVTASYRCCGSPNLCGVRCMDDAETHNLARLAETVPVLLAEVSRLQAENLLNAERAYVANTELTEANKLIAAVEKLHQPREEWLYAFSDERGLRCTHCKTDWPCSTAAVLSGTPGEDGKR